MALLRSARGLVLSAVMVLGISVAPVLVDVRPASAAPPNLVVNPSFEEPDVGTGGVAFFVSIPGWTELPPAACRIEIQDRAFGPADSGDQWVELDSRCATGVFQDIPTTPGATYTITYAFSPRPGVAANTVVVGWDGTDVDTQSASGAGLVETSWTTHGVTVQAAGPTTRLSFRSTDPSDSLGTFVDTVSVTAVVPCTDPTMYLVVDGQLFSGIMPDAAPIILDPVGPVTTPYNAIGYNTEDAFAYGIRGSEVIKIDPNTGIVTVVGTPAPPTAGDEIVGAFDALGDYDVMLGGGAVTLNKIDVVTLAQTPVTLSQPPGIADFTLGRTGGFLWGASTAEIVRVDPATAVVTTFPLPAGMVGARFMGGAFTYPDGDVGFVQNNPGMIYRVAISDPASATPTFSLVSTQASPSGSFVDATSCVLAADAICLSPPPASLPGYNVINATPGVDTRGTAGNDLIIGTDGNDRIAALGGDDIIFGMGGNDHISGGTGDDTLCGGPGDDRLAGEGGDDVLSGDVGNDSISGGFLDDRLFGGAGDDKLVGDSGTDDCEPGGQDGDVAAVPSCEFVN